MKNLHLSICILLFGATCVAAESPRGHDNPDCRQCHMRTAEASTTAGDCRACHADQFRGLGDRLGFHGSGARERCLDCHRYHEPGTVRTSRGTVQLASLKDLDTGHCYSCHEGGNLAELNDAHLAAATLYHEGAASLQAVSPSEACLQCHSNSRATEWQAAGGEVLSFSEHATHPFSIEVQAGKGSFAHRIRQDIDPGIPLFAGRIECQSCHVLAGQQKDLVRTRSTPRELCLGCHQFRDQPAGEMVATFASKR